uniref:F-box/LRR-repeat protein 15-like leucin rich repeat domain-containing protein n=1 Tax=Leersia perrieri TaxID=77586 RepID=A0A0D9VM79_9ORYZ
MPWCASLLRLKSPVAAVSPSVSVEERRLLFLVSLRSVQTLQRAILVIFVQLFSVQYGAKDITYLMEELPESLLEEIVKRICSIEAEQRDAIRVGCGLHPATEAIASLCSRFLNLQKVEIDYSGWTPIHGKQLNNEGLRVLLFQCSLLTDLTLSFCSFIDHSGLSYLSYCKMLRSLRLNSSPVINSSQKMQISVSTPSHIFYIVDYRKTEETGVGFLLRKCKALEKLWLEYVVGLTDDNMITLFQNCRNLTTISLSFVPIFLFTNAILTDESLRGLALFCPMLQVLELTFSLYTSNYLPGVGFSQEGIVMLVKSCPIRALMLNGVHIFDDEGMEAISSSQFLETLELVNCPYVKDAGICSIARAQSLRELVLRKCGGVTDKGVAKLVHAKNLESLTIVGCLQISPMAALGAARSVYYSAEFKRNSDVV